MLLTLARFANIQADVDADSPALVAQWDLVREIHHISAIVNGTLVLASLSPIHRTEERTLKIARIILLDALAMLHQLLAPWHPESMRKCTDSAMELTSVSDSFHEDEYPLLEPTLSVSIRHLSL